MPPVGGGADADIGDSFIDVSLGDGGDRERGAGGDAKDADLDAGRLGVVVAVGHRGLEGQGVRAAGGGEMASPCQRGGEQPFCAIGHDAQPCSMFAASYARAAL